MKVQLGAEHIEAEQWLKQGTPVPFEAETMIAAGERGREVLRVNTLAGWVTIEPGAWVLNLGGGGVVVVSARVFAALFQRVPSAHAEAGVDPRGSGALGGEVEQQGAPSGRFTRGGGRRV